MLWHYENNENGENQGLYCVTPDSHPANEQ
jgi:hypothetical protein